jgi:putative phosphoesterase
MRIGILSDSHDNRSIAGDALSLFLRERVGAVLHLGDVCSPSVLDPFRASAVPILGVFGNNDADRQGMQAVSGNGFERGPRVLDLAGRKILMSHTFDELQGRIVRGMFDLILFGHTHRPLTMRAGRAVVINPGEACGFTSGRSTCAVVDLETMDARILDIGNGADAFPASGGAGGR